METKHERQPVKAAVQRRKIMDCLQARRGLGECGNWWRKRQGCAERGRYLREHENGGNAHSRMKRLHIRESWISKFRRARVEWL